jgi:hypothetical protein
MADLADRAGRVQDRLSAPILCDPTAIVPGPDGEQMATQAREAVRRTEPLVKWKLKYQLKHGLCALVDSVD